MYSLANWPRVKVSDNPKAQVIGITVMENYLKKMAPLLTHRLYDLFSRVMGEWLLSYKNIYIYGRFDVCIYYFRFYSKLIVDIIILCCFFCTKASLFLCNIQFFGLNMR